MRRVIHSLLTVAVVGGGLFTGAGAVKADESPPEPSFVLKGVQNGQTTGDIVSLWASPPSPDQLTMPHGHFHYYLDGQMVGEGADWQHRYAGLTAGEHTMAFEYVGEDHSSFPNKQWREVKVTVDTDQYFTLESREPMIGRSSVITTLLAVLASDAQLKPPGGANKAGEGHFHYFVDGEEVGCNSLDYFKFTGLGKGTHTLAFEFVQNDHSAYPQPQRQEIEVEVAYPDLFKFMIGERIFGRDGWKKGAWQSDPPFIAHEYTYVNFDELIKLMGKGPVHREGDLWKIEDQHAAYFALDLKSNQIIRDDHILPITPVIQRNGQTFVPLRAFADALGYYVDWHEVEKMVVLSK